MNVPKRNHYVPRKYLRAWSVDERRIFQMDKTGEGSTAKLVGIGDAGVQKFFYPPEMEGYFGRAVETPAWHVVQKLRNQDRVTATELRPLFSYLVAQMVRTPWMKAMLRNRSREAAQDFIDTARKDGIDLPAHGYSLDQIQARYEEIIDQAPMHRSQKAERAMQSMIWSVVRLGPFGELITSDNPVYKWGESITAPTAGIIFPLSPKLALVGSESERIAFHNRVVLSRKRGTEIEYKRVDETWCQIVNDSIFGYSHRFLYGRDADPLEKIKRPLP